MSSTSLANSTWPPRIVTALLSAGGNSVDPSSTPLPADAEFTYTAPDEDGQGGTMSLEARSRRGVGKTKIDFITSTPRIVTVEGELDFSLMGMVGSATFDLTMLPGPDNAYTGTAELQLTGSLNQMATSCAPAAWAESLDLMGTLTNEADEQVLVISTTGAPPRGSPVPMTCTTAGVTVQSQTPLISSSLIGETHIRLVDGEQPFVDTFSPATGTLTVTMS